MAEESPGEQKWGERRSRRAQRGEEQRGQGQLGEQMRWSAEESLAEGAAQNFRQVKSHQCEQDIRRAG